MKILAPPELEATLGQQASLFLDTNIFIGAIRNDDLLTYLHHLKVDVGTSLLTIPSVEFEFTRGSDSLEVFNQRAIFLNKLIDSVYDISKHMQKTEEFTVLMQKARPRGDYTDFMLCTCLYYFRNSNSLLMTGDHNAMPMELFDREFVITTDNEVEIYNIGVYRLSEKKLANMLERLL